MNENSPSTAKKIITMHYFYYILCDELDRYIFFKIFFFFLVCQILVNDLICFLQWWNKKGKYCPDYNPNLTTC